MENYILIAILVPIITLAIGYVIKQKKKGVKCIGCPDSKNCSGSCTSCQYGCDDIE